MHTAKMTAFNVNPAKIGSIAAEKLLQLIQDPEADIAAGNWDKITQLCIGARKAAKGE